jgi:hypothetical protein
MGHLAQGPTNGFEFLVSKNSYGRHVWEQVFKYPDLGLSVSYYDYGSDKLGQSVHLLAYADFYLSRSENLEFLFKIGTGFGYHNKPYNRENNNQNVALSSPITQSIQTRFGLNYRIDHRVKLTAAVTVSHFSVAAIKQPNKGLNIPTLNFGLAYLISDVVPERIRLDENYRWEKSIQYNAFFSYALKEIPPIGGPKYPVYVLSFYVSRQVSRTNIITLGIDGFDNTALKAEIEHVIKNPEEFPDNKRIGISFGHELRLNKFSMLTQLGAYIYQPFRNNQPVYQRYALKYYLLKNIYLHYGFVAFFAKADHAEWGIGVTL